MELIFWTLYIGFALYLCIAGLITLYGIRLAAEAKKKKRRKTHE